MTKDQYLEKLAEDARSYRAATAELDLAREALTRRVIDAPADVRQVDILRAIDHLWSREYLRQLGKGQ